ncbi:MULTISPECIES: hypothetical protein [Citrobacter freundii complex]|uniref:hypothetical protein n=1 Tax=Citrobacter freundii complex TaxID=1344959 RepID=UPI0006BCAF9F|nr:hypothetical protein [Citrobacter portucalensis]ALD78237.1 hypothetical protein P10159_3481 [Citrobacter portucalensis]MCX8985774.1 hypothetical protein [Citrobacter portucalensis]MDT7482361.1 hypothetical protein [Citrobacter portucalensis]MDX7129012.1 hypothetical protein [Citrobacter portucalensis]WIJ60680.1 hypothetical protein OI981_09245 [Citrobacter portucalensis]
MIRTVGAALLRNGGVCCGPLAGPAAARLAPQRQHNNARIACGCYDDRALKRTSGKLG